MRTLYKRTRCKQLRSEERRLRELRKEAERLARRENLSLRDAWYILTGEWEPVRKHEWDEF
jgi:hypothetical protein